ncbi:MAG: phosphoadenylyl-sulfate reductase [Bacteroidota bacterium]|nr:phosphoadenylyl-sulfate reductase [Bacteroidota bacterium]MDP4213122.1 phosphoadenylyl-sulfate reductase [Bacteroidota bacterium]MDP4251470.1 phosphoadenylyl-sulfate reductase [Bacteroidota bacterium]
MDTTAEIINPNLTDKISRLSISDALRLLTELHPDQVCFSTSFSLEDQVILHHIATKNLPISVFTLDTGRLFSETYSVWTSSKEKYQIPIQAYSPDFHLLEPFVREKGPNAFYESVENRKQCCFIRKVEPLKRALAGQKIWITGIRAEHSGNRSHLNILEWDEGNQLIKYNPLLHWTQDEVKAYIHEHNIPYNILHDRGFVSIGCAPCTRAIKPGEDFRAGRWWWEDAGKKECGLHSN